jgi:thiosulfate/3-mercaptopyruvate sulfurtransferase
LLPASRRTNRRLFVFRAIQQHTEGEHTMTVTIDLPPPATAASRPHSHLALPGRVVTTTWLAAHLEHAALRLLDVRDAGHFAAGHLPHAQHVDLAALTDPTASVPGMLLPAPDFAAAMSRLAVHPEATVVVYDDNWGLPAARVLWALTRYGFTRAALLTGGWDQWQAEGRLIALAPTSQAAEGAFVARSDASTVADLGWVVAHLHHPDVVFIDTRGAREYAEGHIPGAIHWDWLNAVPVGSWDAVRPAAALTAELARAGVTPDKEIVTYCRSGVRAAHTYWVLRHLGFPRVRNYDGSWLEWQAAAGLPVER